LNNSTYAAATINTRGLPGSGGPGAPSAGTTAYSGGGGAGGAVRILWGNTYDWGTPTNVTTNTFSISEYTTSATATAVMPSVQLGDTVFFVDYAMNASTVPAQVTPSGFDILGTSATSGTTRFTVFTKKILAYTDSGTSLTGATGDTIMSKFVIVVRGSGGAELSDWGFYSQSGQSQIQNTNAFSYTLSTTAGLGGSTGTIDGYAQGVPVCFLFFGSGTGSDINPDSDMTMAGAVTLLGPTAKTCMKVLCLSQSTTSLSIPVSTTDLGSTNTSVFWMNQFY
jgi:hypothetical protein